MTKKNEPKLRIIISGYEVASTEEATKMISRQLSSLGERVAGPQPLLTKRTLISLPISPHKHKDSQEQFDCQIHRRLIEISAPNPSDLKKIDRELLPHTIHLKFKEIVPD